MSKRKNQVIQLRCPLDGGEIEENGRDLSCADCNTTFPYTEVGDRKEVPDFRCLDHSAKVQLTFTIPQEPLQTNDVERFGKATEADFECMSREKIRKLYGTKLQKEVLFYIDGILKKKGTDAVILDLGCGSGGNKKYLESVGFQHIVSVDFKASGSEYLVDAHRLPFAPETFDLILTTATLEHFYNPYIAFKEMNRVLKTDGHLIASASFLESWHGNSCFHFTPGGIDQLCRASNMELLDLWSGWGFIPSISSHALGLSRFKAITYRFQRVFNFIVRITSGKESVKRHTFRTSGSLGLYAQKISGIT